MSKRFIADTNILVRLLTNDDDGQVRILTNLLEQGKCTLYVVPVVIIETYWVLKSVYKFDKLSITQALLDLIESEEVQMEEEEVILLTLQKFSQINVDLVDIYLAEKAKSVGEPILSWNRKHFKKLDCEFYSPEDLEGPRGPH